MFSLRPLLPLLFSFFRLFVAQGCAFHQRPDQILISERNEKPLSLLSAFIVTNSELNYRGAHIYPTPPSVCSGVNSSPISVRRRIGVSEFPVVRECVSASGCIRAHCPFRPLWPHIEGERWTESDQRHDGFAVARRQRCRSEPNIFLTFSPLLWNWPAVSGCFFYLRRLSFWGTWMCLEHLANRSVSCICAFRPVSFKVCASG